MNRGTRHLFIAVAVTCLLLIFYTSLSSTPLSAILKSNTPPPMVMPAQSVYTVPDSKLARKLLEGGADADDPKVVEILLKSFILPPSVEPYNLTEPENINPSMGQAQAVDNILKGKRNGFYVECGGLDGELRSNTLYFEREKGWKGLVIEADPVNFEDMKTKHRKAFISPTCLATSLHPSKVVFAQNANRGHIYDVDTYDDAPAKGFVKVQCFPFYSYMLALNVTTIDYFSLDVEGAEYKVLQTIPFDKLDIKTLSVEYFHDEEGKEGIKNLMMKYGYEIYTEITNANNLANDFIFVKNDLLRR